VHAVTESDHWLYQLTPAEEEAIAWIGTAYHVSEVILHALSDDGVIDLGWAGAGLDISQALARDGVDRVPCLSENTNLAYLVWLIGPSDGAE
tara:strand:- start:203 stop:478 length:276 start_codon:yes stop_codon:yes gene_type:complete